MKDLKEAEATIQPFLIRRGQLKAVTGLSPSSIDRLEQAGLFPARRRVGPGIVGWLRSEVEEFLARQPKVPPRNS